MIGQAPTIAKNLVELGLTALTYTRKTLGLPNILCISSVDQWLKLFLDLDVHLMEETKSFLDKNARPIQYIVYDYLKQVRYQTFYFWNIK